jgi:peptidyl-Lys metalloendopeptidase
MLDRELQNPFCRRALGMALLLTLGAATAASQAQPLKVRLEKGTIAPDASVVEVRFTLSATGKQPMRILKWQLPLEGLRGDLFEVECNGAPIPYRGPIFKRSAPTAADYLRIDSKKNLVKVVDLAKAYDFPAQGDCTIRWRGEILDARTTDRPLQGKGAQLNSLRLEAETVRFSITAGKKNVTAVIGSVSFNGCDATQQRTLEVALPNARALASGSKTVLDGVPPSSRPSFARYITWFGVYDAARYGSVTGRYGSIATAAAGDVKFDCTGRGVCGGIAASCNPNDFAFTCSGGAGATIWPCSAFWRAPASGRDSQAGTIVHELSHWYGTGDHKYGCSDCKALAGSDPARAVLNADNVEYFAENACP